MNKLFTKIATLALGTAMVVGVGVAVSSKANDVKPAEAASSLSELIPVTSSSTLDSSKKYVYATGNTGTPTFLTNGTGSSSTYGGYTTDITQACEWSIGGAGTTSSFYLTDGTYYVSALTSNSYSRLTSAPGSNNLSAVNSSGNLTHSSTTARNLRYVSGSGWRWYASSNGSAGYLYEVASGPDADVVLNKTNNPFTSTSGSNTSTETKTLSGVEYQNYGGYLYNSNYLSINRSINGYIGNNTAFSKNIDKIVVNYSSGGSTYFTMYKGASALAETTIVTPKTTGTGAITYDMGDSNQYFKLKLTTTGTYCNINSISIYLGSAASYSVTKNGTNCTISGPSSVDGSQAESFTITPSTNYDAPETITVQAGSTTLTQNTHYSYYTSDYVGYLTLNKNGQTGNITITAAGVAQLTVTDSVTHGSLSSTARIHSGGDLDVTINPESGYTYPTSVTVTMGGSPVEAVYDSNDGSLYYTPVTGNIVVTATCPAAGNTYSITTNVSNGTSSGDTEITDNGGTASVKIAPTGDYKLPTSVSVSGAAHTYDSSTGVISLSSATGNVTISAEMVALTEYSITVNQTNGTHTGATTIKESRSATITFTAASGYGHPSSVTVSGATSTWTRGTGVLSLSNPTDNVTVTYEAVGNELDSISISVNSGSYTLGDNFVMPTVTAKYTVNPDADVTSSASYSGYDPFTTGNQAVTVSYTEGGITKTASYTANVSAKSVGYSYNKISLVSDITEGDYILAYSSYAFNGKDANNGYTSVTITNDSIAQSTATDKLALHITPVTGGYTLQVSSTSDDNPGKYLGFTSGSNSLSFNANAVTIASQTVSSSTHYTHDSGGAFTFGDSSTVLSWNNNSSNLRYRFYKTSTTSDSTNGKNYYAFDLYKKVSSGSSSLIRITASYSGGEKYVGDPISASDFTVAKQLNTGTQLIPLDSGWTIDVATLTSTSNNVLVSYTENNITKSALVVVPATERSATLEEVVLSVGAEAKLDGYVAWSGATWNLNDIKVQYIWSDSEYDTEETLQTLVDGGEATISPATPTLGATSFTVTYSYLEVSLTNNVVTLDEAVRSDYITSMSWGNTTAAHFKHFSGEQLTEEIVNTWHVKATYAGAGEGSRLYWGDYDLYIGNKQMTSLPYTWLSEDDGQALSIHYGEDVDGNEFVKTNATAVGNICATINAIDHDETHSGTLEKVATWTKEQSAEIYDGGSNLTELCDNGVDIDTNIHMQGDSTAGNTAIRFWSDGIRCYNGNKLTFTPKNGAVITKITFASNGISFEDGVTDSSSSPFTINDGYGDSAITLSFSLSSTVKMGSDVVVEYQIEGSETTTVHYANDINHFDAQKTVVAFAKFMNTTMNGSNVCSGTFANLESAWGDVADKYDELFGASATLDATELAWAKHMLEYATANWGSDEEVACVEKAMKTYEHCVAKYELDPFMAEFRSVSKTSVINPIVDVASNAPVIVTIVVSMIGLSAVGGYFFLRKRKEN